MEIDLQKLAERGAQRAKGRWLFLAAAVSIGIGWAARNAVRTAALRAEDAAARSAASLDEAREALSMNAALRDERVSQLSTFQRNLAGITQSRRAIYEGGLQLQNEKRLLEKQLEIVQTYVLVEEENRKAHVMRGEQALESFVVGSTPTWYGGEVKPLPAVSTVISKERFAHPERGKSEQAPDGQLMYEPPQVGESARANALGEYVVFTKGPLILHGPPKKAEEHAAFPHVCLSLSLPVARKLYGATFIGTKVMYKPVPKTAKK